MNWSLKRPSVSLRIARYEEDITPVPAGLTNEARAAHRAARERECVKVEPAIDLDSADIHTDEPDRYDYTANEPQDYADSVGMRLREKP